MKAGETECVSTQATISGLTGTYNLYVTVSDNLGNTSEKQLAVSNVMLDNAAPNEPALISSTEGIKQSHRATVIATDEEGNLDTIVYCWYEEGEAECELTEEAASGATITKDGVTGKYVLRVKVIDEAGNESEVVEATYQFDNVKPIIEAKDAEGNAIENGKVYKEGALKVIFTDNTGNIKVTEYKNNKMMPNKSYDNGSYILISDVGHYKFILEDEAGNITEAEYIILNKDNTYNVVYKDNLKGDVTNSSVEMEFDKVYLQEVKAASNNIQIENIENVNDNDKVYFMSIVPQVDNVLYSFISNGIDGKALNTNGFSYTINASEISSYLPEGEYLSSYIINHGDKKYILVGVMEGAADTPMTETPEVGTENTTTETEEEKRSTVIYWALGATGVLGVGFIGLKFKKKIRVA